MRISFCSLYDISYHKKIDTTEGRNKAPYFLDYIRKDVLGAHEFLIAIYRLYTEGKFIKGDINSVCAYNRIIMSRLSRNAFIFE